MITGRDFIVTSLQPWDIEIGSTIKNTAMEISRQNRVLYVSTPLDIASRLRSLLHKDISASFRRRINVLHSKVSPLRQINENMWVLDCPFTLLSINKFPTLLFNFFNRCNNKKLGKWIKQQSQYLGFHNYIHLIDTDIFRSQYLNEYIHPALSIYYRRDYIIGFPYWRKHGLRMEQSLVKKSDIVLTNSNYFANQLKEINPHTYAINTGVNLELYNATQFFDYPADLQAIPSPIIGYTGALIESRLNSELLYEVASQCVDYQFVFIDPEDEHFMQHPLHQLANVHFVGRKEVDELPKYIRYFDICINPQIVNPITDGNYPLKIDEYLAMGKPIVATSTHTMRDVFAQYVHLASNVNEFIRCIKNAISESENKKLEQDRINFAHTHSWSHSVAKIYKAIEEFAPQINQT